MGGKREEAARRVPDELILKTNFIGTNEMIQERLAIYRKVGVTTLRVSTGSTDHVSQIDDLAEVLDLIHSH